MIHESTFLRNESENRFESRGNKHSFAEDVIKMVSEIDVDKVILNHFSSRYAKDEIDGKIRSLIKEYKVDKPIFIIYPGEVKRDILNSEPINE